MIKKLINNLINKFTKEDNESCITYQGDILQFIIPLYTLFNINNRLIFTEKLIMNQLIIGILKKITRIPRPNDNDTDTDNDLSFPSGHTGAAAIGAFFYYYNKDVKNKDVKYILILLSLYVAYSRVNSKHHTIYDVSASLLISAHISRIQTTYFNKYF